jgi:hypothetical protein
MARAGVADAESVRSLLCTPAPEKKKQKPSRKSDGEVERESQHIKDLILQSTLPRSKWTKKVFCFELLKGGWGDRAQDNRGVHYTSESCFQAPLGNTYSQRVSA